jgi:peptidoglycan/LPS O-acetylase OafA/YrhL
MYIAFPLVAYFGAHGARLLFLICMATLAATMAAVLYGQGWNWRGCDWTVLSPVLRAIPSFVFGSALFYNRKTVAKLPAASFLLAIAGVVLLVAMMSGAPQLLDLLLVYLVAIAAVAADLRGVSAPLTRRLAPLGQLTYSIYMWHTIFILLIMNSIGDKLLHGRFYAITAVICYICIFTTSYFSFFFIETPARRWVDKLNLSKLGHFSKRPFANRQACEKKRALEPPTSS